MFKFLPILFFPLFLSACSSSLGNEARSDTFDEGEVNRLQLVRIVEIKHVSKSHMVIDSKNAPAPVRSHSNGLLVDLAMLPLNIGSAVATGHTIIGSGSDDGKIVDAVGIDYIDRIDPYTPVMRSTQRGDACEYKIGPAELVRTERGETRIQPNDKC